CAAGWSETAGSTKRPRSTTPRAPWWHSRANSLASESPEPNPHRDSVDRAHAPDRVKPINATFNATTTRLTPAASTVVSRAFTHAPITVRRAVMTTSGMIANGIPNDNNTCDKTSIQVGSAPVDNITTT